jgi:hypothetical protein
MTFLEIATVAPATLGTCAAVVCRSVLFIGWCGGPTWEIAGAAVPRFANENVPTLTAWR